MFVTMNSTTDNTVPSKPKPSTLEEFQLFYEAVDAPDYIAKGEQSAAKASFRDRRIARRRK